MWYGYSWHYWSQQGVYIRGIIIYIEHHLYLAARSTACQRYIVAVWYHALVHPTWRVHRQSITKKFWRQCSLLEIKHTISHVVRNADARRHVYLHGLRSKFVVRVRVLLGVCLLFLQLLFFGKISLHSEIFYLSGITVSWKLWFVSLPT